MKFRYQSLKGLFQTTPKLYFEFKPFYQQKTFEYRVDSTSQRANLFSLKPFYTGSILRPTPLLLTNPNTARGSTAGPSADDTHKKEATPGALGYVLEKAKEYPDKAVSIICTLLFGVALYLIKDERDKKRDQHTRIRNEQTQNEIFKQAQEKQKRETIIKSVQEILENSYNFVNEADSQLASIRINKAESLLRDIESDPFLKNEYSTYRIKEYAWLKYIPVKYYTTSSPTKESWDKSYSQAKALKSSIERYLEDRYKNKLEVITKIRSAITGTDSKQGLDELHNILKEHDLLSIYTKVTHSCARTFLGRTNGKTQSSLDESKQFFKLAIALGERSKLFEAHLSKAEGLFIVEREIAVLNKADEAGSIEKIKSIITDYDKRLEDRIAYKEFDYSSSRFITPKDNPRVKLDCLTQIVRCNLALMDLGGTDLRKDFNEALQILFKMEFPENKEGIDDRVRARTLKTLADVLRKGHKENLDIVYNSESNQNGLEEWLPKIGLSEEKHQDLSEASSMLKLADKAVAVADSIISPNSVHRTPDSISSARGTSSALKENGGFWREYYPEAISSLLALRLGSSVVVTEELKISEEEDVNTLGVDLMTQDTLFKQHALFQLSNADAASTQSRKFTTHKQLIIPIIYKALNKHAHGVGVVLENAINGDTLHITYIDPENNPIPSSVVKAVLNFVPRGSLISFEQRFVNEQSYSNNCGPELVENVVEYITGARIPEELVPYAHSDLFERFLYAESNYMTRPVGLIGSEGSVMSRIIMSRTNPDQAGIDIYSSFIATISHLANSLFKTQLKQLIYRGELATLRSILLGYGIQDPVDEILSDKGFRKVSLRLHPDKGGNAEEFAFAQDLKGKWQQDIDIKPLLDEGIQKYQPILYKTTICFKALDIAADTVRFYQDPQIDEAKKLMVSSMHLYSMYTGSPLSILPAAILVIDTYMKSGAVDALYEASAHAAYIVLPSMLIASNPYIGFAYTVGMTGITAYNAISNAYSLYQEHSESIPVIDSSYEFSDPDDLFIRESYHNTLGGSILEQEI